MKIRYLEIENLRGIKKLSSKIPSDFICLIGPGDSCKSTILSAIEYALSPKWALNFDDSDFYNQDTSNPIRISVTLSDWDLNDEQVKKFLTESRFGQYQCGLSDNGPIPEPQNDITAINVVLTVDDTLEPKWVIARGEDEQTIPHMQRTIFGVSRIGGHLDANFSWHNNSLLDRISGNKKESFKSNFAEIAREIKEKDLELPKGTEAVSKNIMNKARKVGVNITELSPKLDIQKLSFTSGVLTLHQHDIPIRRLGDGSKKLISCAMQMLLNEGKNISLIDEVEIGLEPHRVRGLLNNLRFSLQQVFLTTHSPVVIRELKVSDNELYVCKCDKDGRVSLTSLNEVPDSQGPLRSNAEAFLGKRIIVCEGPTEIGFLRALDQIKAQAGGIPVWSLGASYFNSGGIGGVKKQSEMLKSAGYNVLVFCDNDTPDSFNNDDVQELESKGIKVVCWDEGNSIEQQLFNDIPWDGLISLLKDLPVINPSLSETSIVDVVKSNTNGESIPQNLYKWEESDKLRKAIALSAGKKAWFKRIDLAEEVFTRILPKLPQSSVMKQKLEALWSWIQNE